MMEILFDSNAIFDVADRYAENGGDDEYMWELCQDELQDALLTLKEGVQRINGDFLIYGTVHRWNGPARALKQIQGTLSDVIDFLVEQADSNMFFVNDGDLFWSSTGHDNPCNPSVMKIRFLKEQYDDDYIYDCDDYDKITEPLGNLV